MSDKTLGQLLLSSAAITFIYYTIWTIILVSIALPQAYCGSVTTLDAALLRRWQPATRLVSGEGMGVAHPSGHYRHRDCSYGRVCRLEDRNGPDAV